mmetsp:Transcript_46445/g.140670  ORF Transcript_46445/g.140670 Transcript_46445/m.140670 type:complete len:621 (-) Transcript_46445:1521-3383(-)
MATQYTERGRNVDIGICGITSRGPRVQTPRGYARCRHVFSGSNHAGLVMESGDCYMWGTGASGRLGLDVSEENKNPRADAPHPTLVKKLEGKAVMQGSAGHSHTAVVCDGGDLFIWGSSGSGKLGLGEFCKKKECYCSLPTSLGTLGCRGVARVSCGASHSACVGLRGELFVWGCGDSGRLGLGRGKIKDHYIPQRVVSLPDERFCDVSCGSVHTLALTVIEEEMVGTVTSLRGGRMYCAGPPNVLGAPFPYFRTYKSLEECEVIIKQVSAGYQHQCAVTNEGELLCWGSNRMQCCGHDESVHFISEPSLVRCLYEQPKNIALGKPCRQSSVYGNCTADNGVDGSIGGAAKHVQSQVDAQPYWEVDLRGQADISIIKLWSCTDGSPSSRSKAIQGMFPCWIMISQLPLSSEIGGNSLRSSVDTSVAKIRLTECKQLSIWKRPQGVTGRYVRIQLEALTILQFAQVEVYGREGAAAGNRPSGRVDSAAAGRHVTAAVVRAIDPENCAVAYGRAAAADGYNGEVLRQLDAYADVLSDETLGMALENGRPGGRKTKMGNGWNECPLCVGMDLCNVCRLKLEFKAEIDAMETGSKARLDDIANHILDVKKSPLATADADAPGEA